MTIAVVASDPKRTLEVNLMRVALDTLILVVVALRWATGILRSVTGQTPQIGEAEPAIPNARSHSNMASFAPM
jgi:hypothetical protein